LGWLRRFNPKIEGSLMRKRSLLVLTAPIVLFFNLAFAEVVSYEIATATMNGLELRHLWPRDGNVCHNYAEANAALTAVCEEIGQGVLFLLQVSVRDQNTRAQRTLRAVVCKT
jgi:hypothetical protein